jgi:hypothetical protein
MTRRMTSLTARSTLALLALALASCTGTDGTPQDATIGIQSSSASNTLLADGSSTIDLVVRAFTPEGDRDNSAMTLTINTGTISSTTGTVNADGLSAVITPDNGEGTATVRCSPFVPATMRITADNGNATDTLDITCAVPAAALQVSVNKSQCDTSLIADGSSSCLVTLQVNAGTIPRSGVDLSVSIGAITNIYLPPGDVVGTETDAVRAVLSTEANPTFLQEGLSLATDAAGEARFRISSPEIFFRQTMEIVINGNDPQLGATPPTTSVVQIAPFENNISMTLVSDRAQVVGGEIVTLTLQATNQANQPANYHADNSPFDFADVTVAHPDATLAVNGGTPASTVRAEFINGSATVTLQTPTLGINDAAINVVVTASYQPVAQLAALTPSATVIVNPEGAVLVNTVVEYDNDDNGAPATAILSDDNTSATLTVTIQKDGAPRAFPTRFQVRESDRERIGFDTRADTDSDTLEVYEPAFDGVGEAPYGTPNADGTITAIVSSQNNRVRGAAVVLISVNDTDDNIVRTYETQINVDRDPVLQSVVFVSFNPTQLGVLGSAVPSSANVAFQIFDDLNQPMGNVPVTFSLPDSADPQASVVQNSLSGPDGTASTVVSAGYQVGPLSVIATAQFGGITLSVQSPPIPVTGGLPSFANSYVICDPTTVIQEYAFTATCQLVLADRFTNVTPDVPVQFRAEGGNITPVVTGAELATFSTGAPGRSSPDVLTWSYGIDLPYFYDLQTGVGSVVDIAGCFDGSTASSCNLHALCAEGDNPFYCPLPLEPDGSGCWEYIPKLGLALLEAEVEGCTSTPAGADMNVDCGADGSVTVPGGATRVGNGQPLLNFATYYSTPAVRTVVDNYRLQERRCGFPATCLVGQRNGFSWTDDDNCAIAAGCFDFTTQTSCVHDGLITVMASVRGEESFVDANGNGQFDFVDTNGNGKHDPGEASEAFTDLPEPFLDKNDNCFFDYFNGHPRMTPYEEIRNSDQFSDEDDNDLFGYGVGLTLANGQWDVDRQIMLTSHLLGLVSGPLFRNGELCTADDALLGTGNYTCANGLASTCVEYFNGYGLASCAPVRIVDPALIAQTAIRDNAYANDVAGFAIDYQWADAIGNIHNEGFSQTSALSIKGPLEVTGSTTINLRDYTLGIGETGGGNINGERPWCDDFPDLTGNQLYPQTAAAYVSAKCDAAGEQAVAASLVATHSAGSIFEVGVQVICPVCGDGYLTAGETCDFAIPVGQLGYNAACTSECAVE